MEKGSQLCTKLDFQIPTKKFHLEAPETYLVLCQKFMVELFAKIGFNSDWLALPKGLV